MVLELNFNKDDQLQYQLYKSSKRKSVRTQKIRNRIIASGSLLLVGVYIYVKTKNILTFIFFGIVSLIIFLLYPLYLKILYKRHFSKFIDENYKSQFGQKNTLEITDNFIIGKDTNSESEIKIDMKDVKEIIEIKTNYFIITGDMSAIILPKNNETNNFIRILEEDYNIKLNKELNWKWK